jgi:hypothetical protein
VPGAVVAGAVVDAAGAAVADGRAVAAAVGVTPAVAVAVGAGVGVPAGVVVADGASADWAGEHASRQSATATRIFMRTSFYENDPGHGRFLYRPARLLATRPPEVTTCDITKKRDRAGCVQ